MDRVISLVPSVTETLLAWSVRPLAVTRFCEQPGFPTVGGTKNPDIAAITAMHPCLVVVDREENRAEDASALAAAGIPLHVLHVRAVADVGPALRGLAERLGLAGTVLATIGRHEDEDGAEERAKPPAARRRAFIPIWRRPWMSINAGTYGSSVLEAAGVDNVLSDEESTYPTVDLATVASKRPDVVLAPSEPYAFSERHRRELETVAPVVFVDGKDLFWWGARTPGALERLRRLAGGLLSGEPGAAGA
jgi:ABC-type Fe3+-hydroxamate transport system substrate-binding protein